MIPKGFELAAVAAAIKQADRLDLGLIHCTVDAAAAGVFTRNQVVAAPVTVCRERLPRGNLRAVLVNAGNANACTGEVGLGDARALTGQVAAALGVTAEQVVPCSTGVIGANLPVERMGAAVPALTQRAREQGGEAPGLDDFSRSILTTDTFPKVAARTLPLATGSVRVLGVAKGAGMIRPDMATMLGFILTDARLEAAVLQDLLGRTVARTFNCITVDGDTSTNDTVLALASGLGGGAPLAPDSEDHAAFAAAVEEVCRELARMIVRDGEGAGKVVDIRVQGAADDGAAERAARTIAESPLVKTALHGEDPNWGRIAAALGRSGAYAGGTFDIAVGEVAIVHEGQGLGADAEARAHQMMRAEDYAITVTLREGDGQACITTCDLTAEYIRINADYRS